MSSMPRDICDLLADNKALALESFRLRSALAALVKQAEAHGIPRDAIDHANETLHRERDEPPKRRKVAQHETRTEAADET